MPLYSSDTAEDSEDSSSSSHSSDTEDDSIKVDDDDHLDCDVEEMIDGAHVAQEMSGDLMKPLVVDEEEDDSDDDDDNEMVDDEDSKWMRLIFWNSFCKLLFFVFFVF